MGTALTGFGNDFKLADDFSSVWITVAGLSVYLRQNDEGLSIDVYPLYAEDEEAVAGTWVTYDEVPYTDEALERLWEEFGTPVDDKECLEEPFLHFPKGTHREKVWHWFDDRHSKGVAWLMYDSET